MKKQGFIKFRTILVNLVLIAVVVGALFVGYTWVKEKKLFINEWFVGSFAKGVDISSYQHDVDMEKLKTQDIRFIYIKATEGSKHADEKFAKNWANAESANLLAGAYHFFSFESDGRVQADNYIETVGDLKNRLIPAVDVEMYGKFKETPPEKDKVVRELKILMAVLEDEYKVKPMIYAQKDIYDQYLKDDFKDYPIWARNVYFPIYLEFNNDWIIWQYKDQGELEGYEGGEQYIDLDALNPSKSLDEITIK